MPHDGHRRSHDVRIRIGMQRPTLGRMGAVSAARDGAGIRSADRVLQILDEIGSSAEGLTAAQLATRLGLSTATTYRLLATLVALLAVMVGAVRAGRWARIWAGSGRVEGGRRYPGGPTHP